MKKKKYLVLPALVISILCTGITAFAANCPSCEQNHQTTVLQSFGEHLWHHSITHTVRYTDQYGLRQEETCTKVTTEDKSVWVCPNGHGVIDSIITHRENHTSSHCQNEVYSYKP